MDKPRHPQVIQPWKTRQIGNRRESAPAAVTHTPAHSAAHNLPRTMPRSSKRA